MILNPQLYFSLYAGNAETSSVAVNCWDYFYLVPTAQDIETIVLLQIFREIILAWVCVCACLQAFLWACVSVWGHLSVQSALDKIMACFLIFQSSTIGNVRAWLIPWSLTSKNQTQPVSTAHSQTQTLWLFLHINVKWNTYTLMHAWKTKIQPLNMNMECRLKVFNLCVAVFSRRGSNHSPLADHRRTLSVSI